MNGQTKILTRYLRSIFILLVLIAIMAIAAFVLSAILYHNDRQWKTEHERRSKRNDLENTVMKEAWKTIYGIDVDSITAEGVIDNEVFRYQIENYEPKTRGVQIIKKTTASRTK